LVVQCAEDHLHADDAKRKHNMILTMLEKELDLDYFYLEDQLIIMVKIFRDTLKTNPVLRDW